MKLRLLILVCVGLAASAVWGGGLEAPPSAESVTGLETWITNNISAGDVGAEIEGTVTAHNASAGTLVHGLGTMSTATATDYAKLDTAASFTGRIDFNSSSPTNFTATPTFAGVDVLGNIASALDGILGS